MSLFEANKKGFEEAFKAKDITTESMKKAIDGWLKLYFSSLGHEDNEDDCQRLPVLIVKRLEKAMFSEYSADSDNNFEKSILKALNRVKKKSVQRMFIGGECLLKPIITKNKDGFSFLVIRRDCFMPLARDSEDNLTSVGTMEYTEINGMYYTLFEKRTAGEQLEIEYKLYRSNEKGNYGRQVPLKTLTKYADLPDKMYLNVKGLGLISMRVPLENTVDDSADAVSIYGPAEKLIHRIYENEHQLSREFELGRFRMVVPDDMLIIGDDKGNKKRVKDDIFAAVDGDEEMGISTFNPALRYESYQGREEKYLRNIENAIGLKRGLLSQVEAVERTAKEITSSEGDYSLTITDVQDVWTNAVKESITLCEELGRAYLMPGVENTDVEKVKIDYGNGILYDRAETLKQMLMQVQAGILTAEVYLGEYYGLPYETEEDKKKIREKYMPKIDSLMGEE